MGERDYTPTGQNQVRGLVNGQLVDMYEINYAGPNGITGTVRVPVASATPESVDQLIRERLARQIAISQLGES